MQMRSLVCLGASWPGRDAQVYVGEADREDVRSDGGEFRLFRGHSPVLKRFKRCGDSSQRGFLHFALRDRHVHKRGPQFQEHILNERLFANYANVAATIFHPSDEQIGHNYRRVRCKTVLSHEQETVYPSNVRQRFHHIGHG